MERCYKPIGSEISIAHTYLLFMENNSLTLLEFESICFHLLSNFLLNLYKSTFKLRLRIPLQVQLFLLNRLEEYKYLIHGMMEK